MASLPKSQTSHTSFFLQKDRMDEVRAWSRAPFVTSVFKTLKIKPFPPNTTSTLNQSQKHKGKRVVKTRRRNSSGNMRQHTNKIYDGPSPSHFLFLKSHSKVSKSSASIPTIPSANEYHESKGRSRSRGCSGIYYYCN